MSFGTGGRSNRNRGNKIGYAHPVNFDRLSQITPPLIGVTTLCYPIRGGDRFGSAIKFGRGGMTE